MAMLAKPNETGLFFAKSEICGTHSYRSVLY